MVMNREILKSLAVVILALLRACGGPSLPTPSLVALVVVQTLSFLGALLTPRSKKTGGDDVTFAEAATSMATQTATSVVNVMSSMRWAVGLMVAVLFAKVLRGLGLDRSLAPVVMLGFVGGCLYHCLIRGSLRRHLGCSSDDPAFWQPLDLAAGEDDHTSPLADLVQDYYGPCSMLSEVADSMSTTSAAAAMTSGAASATASTGALVSASILVSAAVSKSSTMCFVLTDMLARALHFMGLCNSHAQMALLASLGGGICFCISAVSAQAQLSGRELSLPSEEDPYDPTFWPKVVTTLAEEQEHNTPLSSLTAEYIGNGMVEYVPCFEPVC